MQKINTTIYLGTGTSKKIEYGENVNIFWQSCHSEDKQTKDMDYLKPR